MICRQSASHVLLQLVLFTVSAIYKQLERIQTMEIRLRNLRRNYGSLHAVDDVSLDIPSNTVYGIIGKSGAGKSTLVRLVSMLEKPDNGEVYYDDKRVDNLSKKELIESNTSIGKIVTVTLPNWDSVNTIITEDDTIVIFSKYRGGSVIVERKPVKK